MADQLNNNPNQAFLGLNTDSIASQIKQGQLTYALNAQIDSFDGNMVTYQNEQSNVLASEFKAGYRVIGIHNILEQNRTIIWLANPHTGDSEIGIIDTNVSVDVDDPSNLNQISSNNYVNNGYNNLDDNTQVIADQPVMSFYDLFKKLNPSTQQAKQLNTYTTLLNAKCLNFNVNNPIYKAVHRIVHITDDADKCGTEVYWADGINPRRFINIDNLPFQENIINDCDRVKSNVVNCDLMEVQPVISLPILTPMAVTDGGSITAGSYQFALGYANDKGETYTAYYSITNPLAIHKSLYGLDYNFQTDKSIKIKIANLDVNFRYFNLAVIKTVNGVPEISLVGTYQILKDTAEVTYSGNNKTAAKMSIEDIFQKYPYYKTASEINVTNGVLMWGNLKSDKRVNYQSIANNIKLQWMTYQIPYNIHQGYYNGVNTALYRGYMRDEVYPFELVLILKNGQQTDGFHIPGRVAQPSDLATVSNDDVLVSELGACSTDPTTQPNWKVYNTGSETGTFNEYTNAIDKSCYIGPHKYGEFAYWESEKTYPCDTRIWGNLAGQPIRHHKFPDSVVTHIHDANPDATDKEFEHKVFPIGIKLDLENIRQAIIASDLSEDQKSQIIGYKIVRGDRVNNKSVIAKGLLYNVGAYTPYTEGSPVTNQTVFYPNYPFNDLGNDPFLTNLDSIADGNSFSISKLDQFQLDVETALNQLDILNSNLSGINAVCYTATNDCASDAGHPSVISITNSQKSDLQNIISQAKTDGNNLLSAIQDILDSYDDKVKNGDIICLDDVVTFTLDVSKLTTFKTDLNNIHSSSAIVNFNNIISYINTNAASLDSNVKATDIFNLKTALTTIISNDSDLQKSNTTLQSDSDDYSTELVSLGAVSCTAGVGSSSSFSKSRFTFHSPDTSFYQPTLGGYLKFETVEGGSSLGNFVQVQDHAGHKLMSTYSAGLALTAGIAVGALFALEPKQHVIGSNPGATLTLYYPDLPSAATIAEKALFWNTQFKQLVENLIPYKNYAYQYNAVGYYNTFNPVSNSGNKQRALDKAYYLSPGLQSLGDIHPINNWKRESSIYFRINQGSTTPLLPNDPLVKGSLSDDNSRVSYSSDKQIQANILSYYASNKRKMPDQYGDIYSYSVVDTGYQGLVDLSKDYTNLYDFVFGGDIFINRFGLKRKLSYFLDTAVGRPRGADIEYSNLSNIGRVKYWYNTSSADTPGGGFKGLMKSLLGVPQSNLDGNSNKLFYQDGRMYLYSYGVAYFFVESEVNVDMRQAGNARDKDFFPNMGDGIPNDWLQEINVPITHDNYYIYNKTYSKESKENYFSHLPINFDPTQDCQNDFAHRVIYSDPNKWRIYKPISYFDFPENYGDLISIDTIDNSQVLVRFTNKSFIYNALTAIQTSSSKYAYLGNDDVFKAQPMDLGETDLGYAGSQHKMLIRTEAGSLFVDSARSNIFLLSGQGATPISGKGMGKWFVKNLPFEMTRFFPNVNTDNHFNGIGFTGVWDNNYNRFIITKLDYAPQKDKLDKLRYDEQYGKFYYNNMEVLLNDTNYFCNKSWTISYSPVTQAWVSFHSYTPNFYIGGTGTFMTGVNGDLNNQKASTWIHNLIHTSYQSFYGKVKPYVLEYPFAFKSQDEILQNVKDYTSILEYYNENDYYEINDGIYFNKAILWNNQQCSGVLNLVPKPKNRLNDYMKYPIFRCDSKDILFTKSDGIFNYNTFWDVVKNPNNHIPVWVESCESKSVDKELNNDKFDYSTRSHQKTKLRAKELRIRHINDKYDRYRFVSKFILAQTQISQK